MSFMKNGYKKGYTLEDKNHSKIYLNSNKFLTNTKSKNNNQYFRDLYKNRLICNKIINNLIIILNLLFQVLSIDKSFLVEFKFSKIILKINGTGYKNIFSMKKSFFESIYYPNQIHINGYNQSI